MEKYKRRHTTTRTCAWCGKEFEAATIRTVCCSEPCRRRWNHSKRHPDWYRKTGERECQVCGKIFEPLSYRAVYCSRRCKDKERPGRAERQRELYAAKRIGYKSRSQIMREAQERQAERDKQKEKELAERYAVAHYCVQCGREFHTLQPNQKTCSKECSRAQRNRRNDKRINQQNIVDRNITLATLYRRDKGVCHICGMPCDYNDFEIRNGNKVVLDLYPTIDHVIPLARGGLHEWGNVKLAHKRCNSIKSANADDKAVTEYCRNAGTKERKPPKDQRKKTIQMDRDGNLVAVYESTAEAEKKTGIKQRGIQKCARGKAKTWGGFRWAYL